MRRASRRRSASSSSPPIADLPAGLTPTSSSRPCILMREWQGKGAQVSLCLIGSKGLAFFRRLGTPILGNVTGLGDRPHVKDLIGAGQGDARCLPRGQDRPAVPGERAVREHHDAEARRRAAAADPAASTPTGLQEHWDYIYEPEAAEILDGLLMRYIESQVYRGAVENVASEMAARMVAMKARHRQCRQAHQRTATRSTTRPARPRSPKNFRRSSAARRRFEREDIHDQHCRRQDHPDHRRRHRRRVSARVASRTSTRR